MAEIQIGAGEEPPCKKLKFEAGAFVFPEKAIKLLRESLQALDKVPYCFNLIKITKSNAEECVPFSKCFVQVERSSDKNQADRRIVYDFASVFTKGIEVLNVFLKDPTKVPVDKEVRIALQRLVQTTLKIEDIGEKLAKKLSSPEKKRETEWCITLVNHLLKELSVNQQYRIDVQSKFKAEACSCCNESVYYDDCSLGNPKVWHGNVDIFMGPHPEVVVHASGDPCAADAEGSLSSFEVKDSSTLSNDISQIISETIVFAFLQKKDNPSFENYLIPTVAISKRDILFYMYDPEYDVLLESAPFRIFESTWESSTLSYPTVLALWFILNYKTFCTGITVAMKERNFTADFLSHVDNRIKSIYKEHLQFGDCGTGSIKPVYHKPTEGAGWQLKKSRPFKSSFSALEGPNL